MSIPGSINPLFLGAAGQSVESGYLIERSLRFNSADSAYLSRTPASSGNRKTWTWAGWVKRAALGSYQTFFHAYSATNNTSFFDFRFDNADKLTAAVWTQAVIETTQVFRDLSAWLHIVLAVDTPNGTAANRMRLYVNGAEVATFAQDNRGSYSNADFAVNATIAHNIGGRNAFNNDYYFNGYLADIHFIDGQALTPSSFGEFDTNNVWQPKAYTGSYGTNGFRLPFSDNSAATATTLGKDAAGSNNWTVNNISVTAGAGNDSLVDSPTNYGTDAGAGGEVRGNYATLNALTKVGDGTVRSGNLELEGPSNTADTVANATIGVSSGKWYWEVTALNSSGTINLGEPRGVMGIKGVASAAGSYSGSSADGYGYATNGQKVNSGSFVNYGAAINTSDVIGVALDLDNGTIAFYENNLSQGTAYSSLPVGTYFPSVSGAGNGVGVSAMQWACNFGQRPFAYTAPSGFKALTTANLPTPLIANGATAMDVALYTGNGSTQTISGLNFSPDLVWIKRRDAVVKAHQITDTVRGINKYLFSDQAVSEQTRTNQVTGISLTDFTLGNNDAVNDSGGTYAAWTWDAGSSTVTNTQGSITSQVRANASAGFSIVSWIGVNGANGTIGHGLGVAPQFVILKNRGTADNWRVYHVRVGATGFLQLASTGATVTSDEFQNTSPTSSVFYLRGNTWNAASNNYIGYFWAPQVGYTSAGSYTGNGSADGPFVYTSMRPRWILLKRTNSTGNWTILDTAREGYNVDNDPLFPNLADAEGTADLADILSNGFKLRSTDASVNASGGTYIYYAISETAFQYSRAR